MVVRLIRALPGVQGLLATVALRIITARLDPSVGGAGPHVLAVRAGSARPARRHVHRIPLPTSVTIAIRPSWRRDRRFIQLIFASEKAKCF